MQELMVIRPFPWSSFTVAAFYQPLAGGWSAH